MKHNLSISVSKKPVNRGVLSCRTVTVRERFLRFLLGDRVQLTVLVPGRSVQNVCISEVKEGGEQYETV